MVKLSKRLMCICEMAQDYKRIADIGCDHGKVLGYLAEHYKPEFLLASDISAPSAEKAKLLLTKINFPNFDVRVGNGLQTLNPSDNLDLIIIAGMGGLEIIEILSNSKVTSNLILEPQNNEQKLRKFLSLNNYKIIQDFVVLDKNRFYTVLKVEIGVQNLTDMQIKYGTFYLEDKHDFIKYLEYKKQSIRNRLKNIKNEETQTKNKIVINEINIVLKTIKNKEK